VNLTGGCALCATTGLKNTCEDVVNRLKVAILIFILLFCILIGQNYNIFEKIYFYCTHAPPIHHFGITFTYNFGMKYSIINNDIVIFPIGQSGNGDLILSSNTKIASYNEIIDYYIKSNKERLINHYETELNRIPALCVEFYALPQNKYMKVFYVPLKNLIIAYTGLEENLTRYTSIMQSIEFANQ
jgi:hypothetical protein